MLKSFPHGIYDTTLQYTYALFYPKTQHVSSTIQHGTTEDKVVIFQENEAIKQPISTHSRFGLTYYNEEDWEIGCVKAIFRKKKGSVMNPKRLGLKLNQK